MSLHRWTTPSMSDLRRGRTWGRKIAINKYPTALEQAVFLDDKNTFASTTPGPTTATPGR
jgi:hypothetical protein